MSDHICPGKCNSRPRRDWAAHDKDLTRWQADMAAWTAAPKKERGAEPARPAEPTTRWNPGTPYWCLADASAVRSALADLDEQMTLRLLAGDGHSPTSRAFNASDRISSSPEPSSPSPAHDDLDELVRWLHEWETAYRHSQGWPTTPYRGEAAPALTSAVGWLLAHLDGILTHPDHAEPFGVGVLYWHNRLTAAAKTRPRRVSMQLRCPQCHLATLSRLEGEDRIECRNRDCGANRGGPVVMTVEEYEGRAAELLPAARKATRVPQPHQTIQAAPGDDLESRAAGPRGVSLGVRIDPDTMRLILDHPHRGPLTPAAFAAATWPSCPRCGKDIIVEHTLETLPGKEPLAVGARILPAFSAQKVAQPTLWRCSGPACSAGGGAS